MLRHAFLPWSAKQVAPLPTYEHWKPALKCKAADVRAMRPVIYAGCNSNGGDGMLKYKFYDMVLRESVGTVWIYVHVSQSHQLVFREVFDENLTLVVGEEKEGALPINLFNAEGACVLEKEFPVTEPLRATDIMKVVSAIHQETNDPLWSCNSRVRLRHAGSSLEARPINGNTIIYRPCAGNSKRRRRAEAEHMRRV